jgi:hypothetical protein
MGQVPAFFQRMANDKHPEQKKHDVKIHRMKSVEQSNLSGDKHCSGTQYHYLPYLEPDIPDLPDCNKNKNRCEGQNRNVHGLYGN